MTEAWSSFLQTLLWISIIVYFIFKLRKLIQFLPDIIKNRLEEGASFDVGPVSIGTPPEAIKKGEKGAVTSEGTGGIPTSKELEFILINRMYPTGFSDDYYLVHSWESPQESSEGSESQFRIRLWLEASPEQSLDNVSRVTYRLLQEFSRQVVSTEARGRDFELWLNTSKELNVIAYVERRDQTSIWLNRHLTLPGRPHSKIRSLPLTFTAEIDILSALQSEPTVIYGEDWTVRVKWEVPGLDQNIYGYWDIRLLFESSTGGGDNAVGAILPAQISNKPSVFTKDIVINHEFLSLDLYWMNVAIAFIDNNNKRLPLAGIASKQRSVYIHTKLPPASRHSSLVSVTAHVLNDVQEKTNFLRTDKPWSINVEWRANIFGDDLLGYWQVRAYLNPLGPGSTTKLEQKLIPIDTKLDQQAELHVHDILTDPQALAPGVYQVVVLVVNVDQNLKTTDVVGFYIVPSPIQLSGTL